MGVKRKKGTFTMTSINISTFGRFIDRTVAVFLVSIGVIVAGATAIAGV